VRPLPLAAPLVVTDGDRRPALDLGELFDRHGRRLYRLALRLTSEPAVAEDLVQDAFLRAARAPSRLPLEAARAEAWLVRVLINLVRDRFRRQRTRRRASERLQRSERDPLDLESAVGARADVTAALRRLPTRRRAVLVLHELEELNSAEIARLLGISRITVRWHLSVGRAQLREQFGVAEDGEERS